MPDRSAVLRRCLPHHQQVGNGTTELKSKSLNPLHFLVFRTRGHIPRNPNILIYENYPDLEFLWVGEVISLCGALFPVVCFCLFGSLSSSPHINNFCIPAYVITTMADKDYDSDSDEEVQVKEEVAPELPPEDATLTNPDVITKYQEAAKIAQAVLLELIPRVSYL